MDDILTTLREAYEEHGYDVDDVTRNRSQVRVVLRDERPEADDLRTIAHDAVDEDDVLGLEITTESVDGQDRMATVVTFRYRP